MIATQNQQAVDKDHSPNWVETLKAKNLDPNQKKIPSPNKSEFFTPFLLQNPQAVHAINAGLNILVDSAAHLFTIIGQLPALLTKRSYVALQKDLIQEVSHFEEAVTHAGYNAEYVLITRYVLCATIDDILSHATPTINDWQPYSILSAFQQDAAHQTKFFNILECALKKPALYIDLLEFIYISLSLGYKGHYRYSEQNHFLLEKITHNLFKHIQAQRGGFVSKSLSPLPSKLKTQKMPHAYDNTVSSLLFIFLVTACIVMSIFISLGYLMDVISNEAYTNFTHVESTVLPKNISGNR